MHGPIYGIVLRKLFNRESSQLKEIFKEFVNILLLASKNERVYDRVKEFLLRLIAESVLFVYHDDPPQARQILLHLAEIIGLETIATPAYETSYKGEIPNWVIMEDETGMLDTLREILRVENISTPNTYRSDKLYIIKASWSKLCLYFEEIHSGKLIDPIDIAICHKKIEDLVLVVPRLYILENIVINFEGLVCPGKTKNLKLVPGTETKFFNPRPEFNLVLKFLNLQKA